MNDLSNFVDFYSAYDDHFVSDYTNILRDNLEQDSKKEAARKLIDEKKAQLTEMQDKVTKITSLIGNNLANDLLISIDGNISLINAMSRSIDTITDGNDIEQALERYMTRFEERTSELQDYIAMTNDKFHESLYYAVKSKAVTINELEDLRNIDGLEEHEIRMIDDTIEQLREEKLDEELNTQAEQQSMEEEKGNNSELIPTPQPVFHPTVEFSNTNYESGTVEEDIEQKPLTLDEKIDNIQYERGMNYGQQVSQVRIDHEIENLNIRLNALKEKKDKNGKLSLKEAIELQSLVNQITHLESLKFNLGKKGQRRETKLANTSSKMASAEEGLVEEQSKDYQSKLFNFVSSIKQQNLSSKLDKLRTKMIVVKNAQREASLLKFDKENKKIVKQAKRSATVSVISDRLHELKNSVIEEFGKMRDDVRKFVHRSDLMAKLREKPISLEGFSNASLALPLQIEENTPSITR